MQYVKAACLLILLTITSCSKVETTDQLPFIILYSGDEFTLDGEYVPVGGLMKFGLSAVGGGPAITNLRVRRIVENSIITELDKGIYVAQGGLDTTLIYVKSDAGLESWNFFIQNENRDTASVCITVYLGEGSAYGEIYYYPLITLGYSANTQYPHFLDLSTGAAYAIDNISGHEQDIDLASFWYITSGKSSPTLTCPAYPAAQTYYPIYESWSKKNSTLYDYKSTDDNLVSITQFDSAENDSLLVAGYKPQNVSGLCKFCYTDKVIPFKTSNGKYGMVKVIRADEVADGSIEIAIKIQK